MTAVKEDSYFQMHLLKAAREKRLTCPHFFLFNCSGLFLSATCSCYLVNLGNVLPRIAGSCGRQNLAQSAVCKAEKKQEKTIGHYLLYLFIYWWMLVYKCLCKILIINVDKPWMFFCNETEKKKQDRKVIYIKFFEFVPWTCHQCLTSLILFNKTWIVIFLKKRDSFLLKNICFNMIECLAYVYVIVPHVLVS